MRSGGRLKPSVIIWRRWPSDLPVRRKNGTPAQRQLSTSTRRATNVSVCEWGSTPGSERYPSYWPRTTWVTSTGRSDS